MRRVFLFTAFILGVSCSFGQVRGLAENIKKIPSTISDLSFVDTLEKAYKKLVSDNADSILIMYPYELNSNYAVIFWKKGGLSCVRAFYQYSPFEGTEIGSECLENTPLGSINISGIYSILKDSAVRMIDTSIYISHNGPVYCQFYFKKDSSVYAGYYGAVFGSMELPFRNAFVIESNRIMRREKEKY